MLAPETQDTLPVPTWLVRTLYYLAQDAVVTLQPDGTCMISVGLLRRAYPTIKALADECRWRGDAGLAGETPAEHLANAAQIRRLLPELAGADRAEAEAAIVRREHGALAASPAVSALSIAQERTLEMACGDDEGTDDEGTA